MVSLRAIFQTPRLELRIFVRQLRGGSLPVGHKEKSWLSVDIPFIGRMRLALEWVKRALQCCSLNLEMGLERPPMLPEQQSPGRSFSGYPPIFMPDWRKRFDIFREASGALGQKPLAAPLATISQGNSLDATQTASAVPGVH